jgi:hypothetical protein
MQNLNTTPRLVTDKQENTIMASEDQDILAKISQLAG